VTCSPLTRSRSQVVIAVMDQGYLALKITDVVLEILHGLHLDSEEVIVVLL